MHRKYKEAKIVFATHFVKNVSKIFASFSRHSDRTSYVLYN